MRTFSKFIAGLVLVAMVHGPLFAQISQALEWGKERAVSEAEGVVLRQIGESVGLGSPIFLNQNHAYPAVPDLTNFHPTLLKPATVADLNRKLPPGDYSLEVIGYCTRASMHGPGRGLPYKLAPLEGKQAKPVSALLVRGSIRHIAPASLQVAAWSIEAGGPLRNMGDQTQALIHQLIPEYEASLQADFLGEVEATYDKYRFLPNMPSLESLLAKSPEGQYALTLQRSRQVLADKTITAENIPDRLYQRQSDGLPRVLPPEKDPEPSPWSQIRPGVIARFTIEQGFENKNLFEFRILKSSATSAQLNRFSGVGLKLASFSPQGPAAAAAAEGLSESEVLGLCAAAAEVCIPSAVATATVVLIAYSIGTPAQPLTVVPVLTASNSQDAISPDRLPQYLDVKDRKMLSNCTPGRSSRPLRNCFCVYHHRGATPLRFLQAWDSTNSFLSGFADDGRLVLSDADFRVRPIHLAQRLADLSHGRVSPHRVNDVRHGVRRRNLAIRPRARLLCCCFL